MMNKSRNDIGGRRSGMDRRQFSYAVVIPERRSGGDRRSGRDRRSGSDRRSPKGFRSLMSHDRRRWFKPLNRFG